MPKRPRQEAEPQDDHAVRSDKPLEIGCEIRDRREDKTGIVVDFACQYAHPKAQPVYNYLIRWQDGQIQAVSEGALTPEYGLEPVG